MIENNDVVELLAAVPIRQPSQGENTTRLPGTRSVCGGSGNYLLGMFVVNVLFRPPTKKLPSSSQNLRTENGCFYFCE